MPKLTVAEINLLEKIKEKEELRPFFFRKAKGLKWFSALEEAGFFKPDQNPRPVPAKEEGYVTVPFWPVTEYLLSTSPELLSTENTIYAEKYMKVLRDVTRYAIDTGYSNYRTWLHFSRIIQDIPSHIVKVDDVVLVDYWLMDPFDSGLIAGEVGGKWLHKLLESEDPHNLLLSEKLLDVIYTLESPKLGVSSRLQKDIALRFNTWHAKKINKKVAGKAGKILRANAVRLFQARLETILIMESNDKWSFIWRSAIEDHDQNHGAEDSEDIIIEAFRDSLSAYIESNPDSSPKFVQSLFDSEYQTVRRVGVYALDRHFLHLRSCVNCVSNKEYYISNFLHEMWHLLHNHFVNFKPKHKREVIALINGLSEREEGGEINEIATAYKRATWFSAISDVDQKAAQYYRECIEKAGAEPRNPDFASYMTVSDVEFKSSIPVEELLTLDIDDLLHQLLAAKDQGSYKDPSFKGLVSALQQAVKAEPLRYYKFLHKFTDTDLPFLHSIIESYQTLWTERVPLPWDDIWESLLQFCHDIVVQARFWSADNAKERSSFVANRYWVVSSIGRLIESGTKSDEHAFNADLLPKAEKTLSILLNCEGGEEFKLDSDAVSLAINSPRGRCIEALINLTLRSCRLSDEKLKNHAATWAHFEPWYDGELERAEKGEFEFATLISKYLPNFMYMSNDWIARNITRIFDDTNYQKWLCCMQGYAYVSLVYENIYDHLKEHGHLIKALDDSYLRGRVTEKIVQNIAVAYINGFEDLNNGLMKQLLQRGKQSELGHLIWFFWSLRKGCDANIKAKVFELWPLILEVIDTSSREGRLIASKLCDWAVFVDEITDYNKPLILAVASFSEEGFNSYNLLKAIGRMSKQQPIESYEIWLRLLEGAKPDFPEEALREALTNISETGREGVRMARNIVSEYLKGGNEQPSLWLREIMDRSKS